MTSLLDKMAAENAEVRANGRPKTAEQEAMEAEAQAWDDEEAAGQLLELIAATETEISKADEAGKHTEANTAKFRLAQLQDELHAIRQR